MPDGTVCLTFDFDAISLWMSRGMNSPGPYSRGEFGAHAVPRLLRLLDARGLPSTWFVPGHTADTYPELVGDIARAGHEIGLHGYAHEPVSALDAGTERAALVRSAEVLTAAAGTAPVGNRTPSWDFTDATADILEELGLAYDSSLMATDYTPYRVRSGDRAPADGPFEFGRRTPLVELPVSWSLDDYPQFEYLRAPGLLMPGLRRPQEVFANFLDDVVYMAREEPGGVCVITFHPQVIGRGHRMLGLEWFLDRLAELDIGVRRCDEVAADAAAALAGGGGGA
ncbi:polysaccharide deacetylase [Streptomonospora sediminis]